MQKEIVSLLTEFQNGKTDCFEEIFEFYKVKMARTAYLITRNRETAEDVVQETFIQCFLKIKELKNIEFFQTWMYKILTRNEWKMCRDTANEIPTSEIFEMFHDNNTDDVVEGNYIQKEESELMYTYIEQLPLKQKTAILLFYYSNCTIAEIAKIMGCTQGTVNLIIL